MGRFFCRVRGLAAAALLIHAAGAAAQQADWTLMLYFAADNDLEQAALIDLDEIEAGMPESGVEVIVFIDRAEGYTDELGDWTDARLLRMRPHRERGTVELEEIARLGEVNTGDPRTLTDFVRFATERFPARRYGLVMWNHGGGWQGMADDEDTGTGEAHDSLTVAEVGDALRGALPQGRKLDLIGFDMCLMAQLEMAYEVADVADFMVASQAVEPAYGWPYDVLLGEFGQATAGPRRLAQNVVRRYAEFTEAKGELVATQSAIDLAEVARVRSALDAVAVKLQEISADHWPALSRSLFWADSFEVGGQSAILKRGERALASSDLLDIVKRARASLAGAFPAEAEFHELVDAVDRAVVDNHVSRRHKLSHGLSIYAPPNGSTFNGDYQLARFAADSRWPDLLRRLHDLQQQHKAAPRVVSMSYVKAGTDQPVTTSSMLDDTTLKVTVEGNHLLWVSGLVGRYSATEKGHLIYSRGYLFDSRYLAEKMSSSGSAAELLMPEFHGRTASMEMEVAPMTYAVGNGKAAAFATLDSSATQLGQGTTASIQAIYRSSNEGEHHAVIVFDLVSLQAVDVVLLVQHEDGRAVPRAVEPRPEDQVTLLYEFLPDDGEVTLVRGKTLEWNEGLELIMDEVPNGTYRTWAIAENLSGETHVASTSVEVVPPEWDVAAGLEGARGLSLVDLAGTWANVDGEEVVRIGSPASRNANTAPLQIEPSLLSAEIRDYQFMVELDTRLLPTLSLVAFDSTGETMLGRDVMMLLADRNRPGRMWIKTMVGGGGFAVGQIVELVRTSRPSNRSGNQPGNVQPPRNPLAMQLVGTWQGQTANAYLWVQLSAQGQYRQVETSFDNSMRMESWGTYSLQGNVMTIRPAGGQSCNVYGCQPFHPQPVPSFPVQVSGGVLQTPTSQLSRQH